MKRLPLIAVILAAASAWAEDPLFDEGSGSEAGWSGSVRLGLDSTRTRQLEVGLGVPLERELQGSIEYGRSFSPDDDSLVDAHALGVELTAAPGADLEGGVRYDFFGNTSEIRTHELTPTVTIRSGDWELTLSPGLRLVVTIVNRPLFQDVVSRSHLSYSAGGSARYLGLSPVTLGVFGTRYLYARSIREERLERNVRIGAISDTAFTVVSGVLDWNYGVTAGLEFDSWSADLSVATSRTFISKADAFAVTLSGEWAVSESWSLGPELGRYLPEDSQPSTFGALSVVYSW